jgi:hypothetical protein
MLLPSEEDKNLGTFPEQIWNSYSSVEQVLHLEATGVGFT